MRGLQAQLDPHVQPAIGVGCEQPGLLRVDAVRPCSPRRETDERGGREALVVDLPQVAPRARSCPRRPGSRGSAPSRGVAEGSRRQTPPPVPAGTGPAGRRRARRAGPSLPAEGAPAAAASVPPMGAAETGIDRDPAHVAREPSAEVGGVGETRAGRARALSARILPACRLRASNARCHCRRRRQRSVDTPMSRTYSGCDEMLPDRRAPASRRARGLRPAVRPDRAPAHRPARDGRLRGALQRAADRRPGRGPLRRVARPGRPGRDARRPTW